MLKKIFSERLAAVYAIPSAVSGSQESARLEIAAHEPIDRARRFGAAMSDRLLSHSPLRTDGGNSEAHTEPYAEGTPLTWVFGDYPDAKIVATFLSEPDVTMDLDDIKRLSGVNNDDDVEEKLVRLEKHGVVSCEWSSEAEVTCSLNDGAEPVKQLQQTEEALLKYWHRT